tara:strand:- start:425 stop:1585 length:1161 start_codon:yes stop_codon:yes gene_type:complete
MILSLFKIARYFLIDTGRYIKRGLQHGKTAIIHRLAGSSTALDLPRPASQQKTSAPTLSDTEFLELCYQGILGRAPSAKDRASFSSQFEAGAMTRDEFVCEILQCSEFASHSANREAYPAGHFFSALPSAQERAQYIRDTSCESVAGIDLRLTEQTALAKAFASYFFDCPLVRFKDESKRYYSDNVSFPFSDAFIFYCFIRRYNPRQIIEIGSGFSSAAALDSLDALGKSDTRCWFIEPYPRLLRSLLRKEDTRHGILSSAVQEVDLTFFDSLAAGDILFIDSTHVSKISSDVNYEIFDILPRLKPGVLIHIHDIYWPFDYPDEWVQEGRAWTESYLVRAFLQFNNDFRILYFNSYLHPKIRDSLFTPLGVDLGQNDGGSLWLERV